LPGPFSNLNPPILAACLNLAQFLPSFTKGLNPWMDFNLNLRRFDGRTGAEMYHQGKKFRPFFGHLQHLVAVGAMHTNETGRP
jgi:hypothetical protein